MLTRSQVAKRLGKSIATIRRMEGTELFPTRDARGVYRFDPKEVDQVLQECRTAPRATAKPHRTRELQQARARIAELEEETESERVFDEFMRHDQEWREQREAQAHRDAEQERLRALEEENDELRAARMAETVEFLQSLTPREVCALSDEEFEELIGLLDD